MAEPQQTENILHAISLTQKLRTSVGKVFGNLGDGFEISQGNEKALLNTFQQSLLAVNNDFRSVRKLTGTGLITGTDRNGLLLFLLPAQFLVISIQYTCTD